MSKLALRLIEENMQTRAPFLDLGNCELTEVPKEIAALVWLEQLSFSRTRTEWDGTNWHSQLTTNVGPANNIERLIRRGSTFNPFHNLKNLKQLWLNGDSSRQFSLSSIAPLDGLVNLEGLDVSATRISGLLSLARMTNLRTLDISKTRVTKLDHLARLEKLQVLKAQQTQVSNLRPLVRLVNLQQLNFNFTEIKDLTPIYRLTNLQIIKFKMTRIAELAPLAGLFKLQEIDLSRTKVMDLSPLAGLTSLQWLDVSQTPVINLSPLADLYELKELQASHTKVSDLSGLVGLSNLRRLDLSETQIADLAPLLPLITHGVPVKSSRLWGAMWWFVDEEIINISGCPLTNPPLETAQQGNEAILRYFDEQRRVGTIKVREAKLLIVGQGKAGKTTLKKKLQDQNAEMPELDDTTRGIEITRLDERMPQTGEPLRINVWDFGGQDIQHYAHQFFLTGNSLYALVTNERIQDSVHLPYWLNIIEMLGKKSPILLIQNKDGGHCQPLRDEAAIRARFSNIHNRMFQTDFSKAATEPEFADLRREIVHQAAQLPHVEREYLASFAELRGKLENKADHGIHYLNWKDFLTMMPELSEDLMRDYANALTFLGVCQYFPDDAHLSQFVFLRSKWIIDALFALLLHPSLEEKRGHFNENDTFDIWKGLEYQGMHALLVRMMEEFELCYRVEGDGHNYILPQRLPSEKLTYGWDELGDTPVEYKYKFMPKGILTRLICRLHPRIETNPERGQRVWCDAVIFALPDGKGRVFAREVYSENTIELRATGDKRAEMLNEVIRKMDDINHDAKYDNLQVEKLVPCPCEECVQAESPGFHDYDVLQKRIEKDKDTSECKKSGEDVSISEIFGKSGVKRPESSQRDRFNKKLRGDIMPTTSLKVFISYSHAQRDYFPIFKKDLNEYTRLSGLDIQIFDDNEIPIGSFWDELLQNRVANCDVMILLVSQEFMNSQYIQEKEFGAAIERLKNGHELLVAPVYFAPCKFNSEEELARLQFFKPHGEDFDESKKAENFSYIDLVKFRQNDGQPIPNSNRQHYMMAFMKKLEPELRKLADSINSQ
ncbi:MAG TPA: COR domain-containing protein [Methylobacter sp.]|jgi:Leucine-rich repeat (LRR) protein/GTPase SAR1 family protein